MNFQKQLRLAAVRLANDDLELRHALLDVSDELLQSLADESVYPGRLRAEVRELHREIEEIQPRFRSHRSTSSLFDREGLGEPAKKRARHLALRVIAVAKAVQPESDAG